MSTLLHRARHLIASPRTVAAGAVLLGLVGLRFAFFGGSNEHLVTVDFADANGLVNANEVRIAGVEAGSVKSISIVHNGNKPGAGGAAVSQYAEVTLEINDANWPLRQGTIFAVRPRGVLSNVYVALTPGSSNAAPLDVGHPIPVSQTSSPVNLDELGNVFDQNVRDSIRTQINQGNLAFGGDGLENGAQNFNGLVSNLNPLTRDLQPITAVLAQRTPELQRLDTEYNTILGELAREDQNLRGVINNGDVLFRAIVDKQADLQGTLDHAAAVLTKVDQVMTGEQSNLIAFFQKGPVALDKNVQANDLLNPLVTSVNPHIPHLQTLLHYFVTGNGYVAQGVDSLRVDGSLPLTGRTASPCGGEPKEQGNCKLTFASSPVNGSSGPTVASAPDAGFPGTTLLLGGLVG